MAKATEDSYRLVEAARDGDTAAVRKIASAPGFEPTRFHEQLALVCAAGRGHQEIVMELLDSGVDPNAEDSKGETAIMAAVSGKHAAVARLLVERGADPSRSWGVGANELKRLLVADG